MSPSVAETGHARASEEAHGADKADLVETRRVTKVLVTGDDGR